MRIALCTLALLAILASRASAWEPEPWTREQVALEATYAVLVYVDWRQTVAIARRRDLREVNPILGSHPSEAEVTRYMVTAAMLHAGVSALLPDNLRTRWQYLTVGYYGGAVWRNWQVGLTLGF